MKVLLINSVCGTGSTGRICENIAKQVNKEGRCVVAFGRGEYSGEIETYKIGNMLSVYEHGLESLIFSNHGLASRNATKKLVEFIRNFDPDVINIHNIHGYYLNYEILFRYFKESGKKIIWTLHDCWPFSPHSAYIDQKNGLLPTKIESRVELMQYPKTLFKFFSRKNYEKKRKAFTSMPKEHLTFVSPSYWLAELSRKSFFYEYPVNVIRNGIDLSVFKQHISNEIAEKSNKKVILGVANYWDSRKGLTYFYELSDLLSEEYEIVLVGKINGKKIKKENIKYFEKTDNANQLASLYSSAYVFVNPTLADNFPTTNLESLACGTPVITFNSGGSGEPITKEVGIVLQKKTATEIYLAIEKINVTEEMKHNCVVEALKYSEIDKFKEYIKLFKQKNVT